MQTGIIELIRSHSRPLTPVGTAVAPVLHRLDGVKAVLFDVYGTLFVSGSGDLGSARLQPAPQALCKALASIGLVFPPQGADKGIEVFFQTVESFQAERRDRGIEYPEVDIVEVWRQVLATLRDQGLIGEQVEEVNRLQRLAVEYEVRVNPVWPMPGAGQCLERLRRADCLLGIISNAQFFTPALFPALLNRSLQQCGFDQELCLFSFRYGRAKPGRYLFAVAERGLRQRGLEPHQTVYVGNDLVNDVMPAQRQGLRTALFAGDARSLRLHQNEPRCQGIVPDLVLTSLEQLAPCIGA